MPNESASLAFVVGVDFAINAAANDTRIKATVASTMYDISRCTANGYFDAADNADARYKIRQEFNTQRTETTVPTLIPHRDEPGAYR